MAKKPAPKKRSGTLTGFIVGFILGAVVASIAVYIVIQTPVPFVNKAPQAAVQPPEGSKLPDPNTPLVNRPSAPAPVSTEPTKPSVVVATPSVAPATTAPTTSSTTTPSTQDATIYYLQVGAYRASNQADEMSTRLIFLGYAPQVQTGESGGSAIHRVRLGPYKTSSEVEAARAQLSLQGMDASVIKLAP